MAARAPSREATILMSPPSGDTTGVEDTGLLQDAIDRVSSQYGAGQVKLREAPTTSPYWITQGKLRSHVTVRGQGRIGTVCRVPVGQSAAKHVFVLNDPTVDYDVELADLAIDGNNGNVTAQTWGAQVNSFDGINWVGNPPNAANDITSLYAPYSIDGFCRVFNVLVTRVPGQGVVGSGKLVCEWRNVVAYWTGSHGFNAGTSDCVISDCTAGLAGVQGSASGFRVYQTSQLSNCKAFWSGVTFSGPSPTWGAPGGKGFEFTGKSAMAINCYAQDCGYGFDINNGAKNCFIRGHVSRCAHGVSIDDDYFDIEVHIDADGGSSGAIPAYFVEGYFGKTLQRGRIQATFDPDVTPATGYFYGGADHATKWVGCDVKITAGKSQTVAYTASITPNPFIAPTIRVGTLTGALTINAPTDTTTSMPYPDQEVEFWLPQDSTGGRVVTFNAAYLTTAAIPTTLSTTTVVKFRYDADNAKWREVARSTV